MLASSLFLLFFLLQTRWPRPSLPQQPAQVDPCFASAAATPPAHGVGGVVEWGGGGGGGRGSDAKAVGSEGGNTFFNTLIFGKLLS